MRNVIKSVSSLNLSAKIDIANLDLEQAFKSYCICYVSFFSTKLTAKTVRFLCEKC